MTTRQHARRLVWPTALVTLALGLVIFLFYSDISSLVEGSENLLIGLTSLTYFAMAWLASRLSALALDQAAARRRPYPRLLRDLIAVTLFLFAFAATVTVPSCPVHECGGAWRSDLSATDGCRGGPI